MEKEIVTYIEVPSAFLYNHHEIGRYGTDL